MKLLNMCFILIIYSLNLLASPADDFDQLPRYKHINVAAQFEEYDAIYSDKTIVQARHVPELARILKERAFPLWKDFIVEQGIEGRQQESLEHLRNLFIVINNLEANRRLSCQQFWFICVFASVIIDWHKGLITKEEIVSEEREYISEMSSDSGLFKALKEDAELGTIDALTSHLGNQFKLKYRLFLLDPLTSNSFTFNGLSFIVFTNISSGISADRLVKYTFKYRAAVFTVFDCTLYPKNNHFNESNKYLAHRGLLSTSTFLNHDLYHCGDGILSEEDAVSENTFQILYEKFIKNNFNSYNNYVLFKNALYIMTHELRALNYPYKERYLKKNEVYFTKVGNLIASFIKIMPHVVPDYEADDRYSYLASDWENSLREKIYKSDDMDDAEEFFSHSLKDVLDNPLIPSLSELFKTDRDNALDKWKMMSVNEQYILKKRLLSSAYQRFWESVFIILLENCPEVLIHEDYLSAFIRFIKPNIKGIYNFNKDRGFIMNLIDRIKVAKNCETATLPQDQNLDEVFFIKAACTIL